MQSERYDLILVLKHAQIKRGPTLCKIYVFQLKLAIDPPPHKKKVRPPPPLKKGLDSLWTPSKTLENNSLDYYIDKLLDPLC